MLIDSMEWFVIGPLVRMSLYSRLVQFYELFYSFIEPSTPEYFRLFLVGLVGLVGLVIVPSLYETAKVCSTRIGK